MPRFSPARLASCDHDPKRIYEQNPLRVWTMVDCDNGMCLIQGLHHVNRIYYIITVEPAENEFEEYLFDSYENEVYYE